MHRILPPGSLGPPSRRRHLLWLAALGFGSACGPTTSPTAGRWERRAGLAVPRDDFGFAAAGKQLYAIGGMTGARGNALDSVETYAPTANTWTRAARLPAPAGSLRAATLGDRIYVAGGARDYAEVASAWTYAVGDGRWDAVAPLHTPRFGHGLAPLGGRIFAAGGLNGGEAIAAAEAFDPRPDTWRPIAALPEPRFNLALLPLAGRLYAIGGSGTDRRPVRSVFIYDLEADRWLAGPSLPQPLSNFGAAAVGDRRIHAVLHRHHFVLDASTYEWTSAPPMPTSRHGLALEAMDGVLYAAGGCAEDPQRDLPTLEVFRATR